MTARVADLSGFNRRSPSVDEQAVLDLARRHAVGAQTPPSNERPALALVQTRNAGQEAPVTVANGDAVDAVTEPRRVHLP
jgi:hypothetical protein